MAAEEIALDTLRQLLGIQTDLREQAEGTARKAQRALVSLLETFAPEVVDQRLKNGMAMDHLPVEDLEQLIRQSLGPIVQQARTSSRESQQTGVVQTLREKVARCEDETRLVQTENTNLKAQISGLENERDGLIARLAVKNNAHVETKPMAGEQLVPIPVEPEWMAAWRKSDTFERDSGVLKLLGESGLARRPQIEIRVTELLGIKKAGGSVQSLFGRLQHLQLVEVFRPWGAEGAGSGGRFPDLMRLSERGRLAFWLLTGSQPVENEYDQLLKRHVSPEHTILNIQAADLLSQVGYQVNPEPQAISLPGGEVFSPDLSMVDSAGRMIFVEVEREAHKDLEKRQAKWRNFHQVSGGNLFVICENRACMRAIRSEINFALGNRKATVSLTNLGDLQLGLRGNGDSIWLEVKEKYAG